MSSAVGSTSGARFVCGSLLLGEDRGFVRWHQPTRYREVLDLQMEACLRVPEGVPPGTLEML